MVAINNLTIVIVTYKTNKKIIHHAAAAPRRRPPRWSARDPWSSPASRSGCPPAQRPASAAGAARGSRPRRGSLCRSATAHCCSKNGRRVERAITSLSCWVAPGSRSRPRPMQMYPAVRVSLSCFCSRLSILGRLSRIILLSRGEYPRHGNRR